MVEQAGALGYFGDARRAAVGTELLERVTATGSLVIRKLGATRAGELAIHRVLSAPSVSCREMLVTLAGSTLAATAPRHIVVAQDTTAINFAGRGANRRGLGAAGDGVAAGFFIHPLVAIDSETEAALGLLDAQIWTRDDAIEAAPRRQRAIEGQDSGSGVSFFFSIIAFSPSEMPSTYRRPTGGRATRGSYLRTPLQCRSPS